MAVISVLCGYKLKECVHNHWSGLNVRVIKGTMEITSNATPPAASISWSMTLILGKLKDIPVPDVFGTICLQMITFPELNNCNYCNCQIWDAVSPLDCSRCPDVAPGSSLQYWEFAARGLQGRCLQLTEFVGDINTVQLQTRSASNLSRFVIMASESLLSSFSHCAFINVH